MRPGALNELLAALSRRAQLAREIHPHMLGIFSLLYACAAISH